MAHGSDSNQKGDINTVESFAIVLTIIIVIAILLIAGFRSLIYGIERMRCWRDKSASQAANWIRNSDLSDVQKDFLIEIYLPKLLYYRRNSIQSGRRFQNLAKQGILFPTIAAAMITMITAVPQQYWIYGLILVALLSMGGVLAGAFDRIERNNDLWRDNKRIADALENSLRQLLTEQLDLEIQDRWQQFCSEYESIMEMEQELFDRRAQAAQTAATGDAVRAQEELQRSREAYRGKKPTIGGVETIAISPETSTREQALAEAARLRQSLGVEPRRVQQKPEQIEINRQQAKAIVAMQTDENEGTQGW